MSKLPKGLSIVPTMGATVARLYDTNIVTWDAEEVRLNTGGWETRHTKKCMNIVPLGHHVYQEAFRWYVRTPQGEILAFEDGQVTYKRGT